jgi:hypothetical protein
MRKPFHSFDRRSKNGSMIVFGYNDTQMVGQASFGNVGTVGAQTIETALDGSAGVRITVVVAAFETIVCMTCVVVISTKAISLYLAHHQRPINENADVLLGRIRFVRANTIYGGIGALCVSVGTV